MSKQTGIRAPTPYSGIVKCAAMRVRGIGIGVGSGMVIGIVKQGKVTCWHSRRHGKGLVLLLVGVKELGLFLVIVIVK